MLEEKILEDFKHAMKDKDALRVSVLSFLRSELKNIAIDKRIAKLKDAEVLTALKKQIKQRQDSISAFTAGSREDLVKKESQELEILKSYLPEQLSQEAIKEIIDQVAASLGANQPQDMGRVMKELLPRLAQGADNKLVSELVKQRLTKIKV